MEKRARAKQRHRAHDLSLEHQAALSTMQTRKAKTLPRLLSGLDDEHRQGMLPK